MTEQTINSASLAGGTVAIVKSVTQMGKIEVTMETNDNSDVDYSSPMVEIYVKSAQDGTNKRVVDKIALIKLMEFETLDPEAYIEKLSLLSLNTAGAVAVPTVATWKIKGRIDLTRLDALQLVGKEELFIDLSGLENTKTSYTFRSLEDNTASDKHLRYEIHNTQSTRNTVIPTVGKMTIGIARTANFEKLELRYKNGFVVTMTPAEIDSHCAELHGLVTVNRLTMAGGLTLSDVQPLPEKQHILVLDDCLDVKVNTNGQPVEVILVSEVR